MKDNKKKKNNKGPRAKFNKFLNRFLNLFNFFLRLHNKF